MRYKFIDKYSDFILNETLKTYDQKQTIDFINTELSLMKIKFELSELARNKIKLKWFPEWKDRDVFKSEIEYLQSLFIDRFGWFPTLMIIDTEKFKNYKIPYDKSILLSKNKLLDKVEIIFEAKYDIEINIPDKLYHLSIQEYEKSILNNGICPKSKSKLTKHLDRIYVCIDVDKCYELIPRMKLEYKNLIYFNSKNKIDYKWIIYEINTKKLDIKLYQDPNYIGGYYVIENIHPNNIKIIDKE